MSAPVTTTPDIQSPVFAKIKTTAVIFAVVGCLILPLSIANFVNARIYSLAAPLFCIALAITLFTKKPKAIPIIFVANLVLETFRLIYYFADCFWQYEIDEDYMGVCISLTISCLLMIISAICAVYWLFTRKRFTEMSNIARSAIDLFGLSYAVSEISYIIQLVVTVGHDDFNKLPVNIILVIFNAAIGIMMTKSVDDMFCFLPHFEQIAQEKETQRTEQQSMAYHSAVTSTSHPMTQLAVPVSVADEILKYKQLLDMGAITQEEYDRKKAELLHTNH